MACTDETALIPPTTQVDNLKAAFLLASHPLGFQ